jgi:hypothetical protein
VANGILSWHLSLWPQRKKNGRKNCRKMDNNGNANAIGRVNFLTEPDAAFFWWMNKPKIFVSFQLEKKRRRMDGWSNELRKSQLKKAEVSCGQPGLMECEKNVSLSLNSSFLFFQSESLKVASFLWTILT